MQFYHNPRKDFHRHSRVYSKIYMGGMGPQMPGTILKKSKREKCPTRRRGPRLRGAGGCGAGGVGDSRHQPQAVDKPETPHRTRRRPTLDKRQKQVDGGRTGFSKNGTGTISDPEQNKGNPSPPPRGPCRRCRVCRRGRTSMRRPRSHFCIGTLR